MNGITRLFTLIPGTTVTLKRRPDIQMSASHVIRIKIPEYLDFTRFELYAQYVRTLDLLDVYEFRGKAKATLDSRHDALLPNLISLTCHCERASRPAATVRWLSWFLGPSLLKLAVIPTSTAASGNSSNPENAIIFDLKQSLLQRCPNLREIHATASARRFPGTRAGETPLLCQLLPEFPQLRKITGNESLVEPQTLKLLGTLPHLEYLNVTWQYPDRPIPKTSWSPDSFPFMRSIRLAGAHLDTIYSVWSVPSLVNSLTSIEVQVGSYDFNFSEKDGEILSAFMCSLPACSPHIEELSLSLNLWMHEASLTSIEINALRQLPLRTVYFKQLRLADEMSHLDLVLALPQVRTLRLGSMSISLGDLQHYATHLPNLEVLSFSMNCSKASDECPVDQVTLVPVTHRVTLEIVSPKLLENRILSIAQYLCRLWPNVRCIDSGEFDSVRYGRLFRELERQIIRCQTKGGSKRL